MGWGSARLLRLLRHLRLKAFLMGRSGGVELMAWNVESNTYEGIFLWMYRGKLFCSCLVFCYLQAIRSSPADALRKTNNPSGRLKDLCT